MRPTQSTSLEPQFLVRRTTSPTIFIGNLAAQLRSTTGLLASAPWLTDERKHLAQLHKLCGDIRSDAHAFAEALAVLDAGPKDLLDADAEVHVLRSQLQLGLHRLNDAKAELDLAVRLGGESRTTREIALELDWNEGRCVSAAIAVLQGAAADPSTHSLARLARLETDLGRHDRARATFAEAERLFDGAQPHTLAWLLVERARNEAGAGDLEAAEALARRAVETLPQHLGANDTLGRVLAASGSDHAALAVLRPLADESTNPDHWSELIRVEQRSGDPDRASELTRRAQAAWSELLTGFPEATYWHAAEFHLDIVGDANAASDLLRRNASLRPNPSSWRALAQAELARGRTTEAAALDRLAEAIETRLLRLLDVPRAPVPASLSGIELTSDDRVTATSRLNRAGFAGGRWM